MSKPAPPAPDAPGVPAPTAAAPVTVDPHDPVVLLLTTYPDQAQAESAARAWVEAGLAACVHVGAAGLSVYRWQGAVEVSGEVPVTAKTTAACLEALSALLQASHPYELPEILLVSPAGGSGAYLDWVRQACAPPSNGAVA